MIYIGGYGPVGIRVLRDTGAGGLEPVTTVPAPDDPSYLALSPRLPGGELALYACHEATEGRVSAYSLADPAAPRPLGELPSGGAEPCHLSVDPGGQFLYVAHWGTGNLTVLRLGHDGSPLEIASTVEYPRPHAHMVATTPDGRWVVAVHLGMDAVDTYRLDRDAGTLERRHRLRLPDGTGPRHLAFHPDGRAAYLVNELASTVTACGYDPETGQLTAAETECTVPPGVTVRNHPSAIRVSPDGRFVYLANRFHDSIAVLQARPRLRLLDTYPCGGSVPRDMQFTPDGGHLLVANERADLLTTLAVHPDDGSVGTAGSGLPMSTPTCVVPLA